MMVHLSFESFGSFGSFGLFDSFGSFTFDSFERSERRTIRTFRTTRTIRTTRDPNGYVVILNSLVRVPPRIASFSVLFRNGALRTRSTVTGQLNGLSVPYTICETPISLTRWRSPSSEKIMVSTMICVRMYSFARFLLAQLALPRTSHAASVRPKYDGR